MARTASHPDSPGESTDESLGHQVRSAVIWRSGSQIAGQLIAWASTFLVIRILDPNDYGLFAMTQVILVLLNMLNGYGLASAIIQQPEVTPKQVRQLFGLLIVLNLGLALLQFAAAPLVAAYDREPVVTDMLRVQVLLYFTTPFIALPYALLSRRMDFKKQAQANMLSSIAGAGAALAGALAGLEMWTLVWAPIVLFGVRGLLMTWFARSLVWPSFDFRGVGHVARYGGVMAAGQLFWFLQSQTDVFIAGRQFDAHRLGIYTTSLFLTQIFVAKFVPPLNEVAFSAYARIQHDKDAMARAFVRSVRTIFVAALPFYLGLAAVSEPLVLTALGPKWAEAIPIVHILALAMPFMTLNILYGPASDACGKPGVSVGNGAFGAAVMTIGFMVGVRWDALGLAVAWLVAYPIYLAISTWRSLPLIGASVRQVADAIAPPLLAALAMAIVVTLIDRSLPPLAPQPRLAVLAVTGALVYGGWMLTFSRDIVRELLAIVLKRPLPAA